MDEQLKEHIMNMLKYVKDVVWCVDANTYDLLYTSEGCVDVWGFTAQEMMSDKNVFFDHLYPDDVHIYRDGFQKAIETGSSHNEFRIIHKDGSVRVIKGDAIFLKGKDGFPDTMTGIVTDITEQRNLTDRLAASEKKFHTIADDSPIMVWTSSAEMGLTYVNKAWTEFTGKTLHELQGSSWTKLIHPEDQERVKASRDMFYDQRKKFEIRCRFMRHDGEYRIVLMRGIPQLDAKGKVAGFLGNGYDMTEIITLTEKLRDSELRFRSIANDSPVLMWTTDPDLYATFFNAAWLEFSGMKEGLLKGDGWLKLVHADDLNNLELKRNVHYGTREPYEAECRLQRKDGKYRWIYIKESPQFNAKKEFTGFVGNGVDMTDVKTYYQQIEKTFKDLNTALHESKRLLHIVNRTNNIIILADTEGRITWVNEAYVRTTGYTLKQSLGKKPGHLVQGPDTDPQTVAILRNAIAKGERVKAEILNYAKDGRKYWLDVRIEPLYKGEELTGFMAIEVDITQRKMDEKALQESNKRIRQFSFITSHELRHEFSKIMLLLDASKMAENTAEDVVNYFAELEEPANKINSIIMEMNEQLLAEGSIVHTFGDIAIKDVTEICLIDDDKLINSIHQRLIKKLMPDMPVKVFENIEPAFEYVKEHPSSTRLIFLDLNFPDRTGWHFLDKYTKLEQKSPVIILSSSIDGEDRERSKQYKEVADFFIKPLSLDVLHKLFNPGENSNLNSLN